MRSDWVRAKIEDICSHQKGAIAIGPFGSRLKSDNYVESGVPVIRGANITGGPNFEGEFVYITEEKAAELGSANVYKNDLVFPHRGAIGEVGIVVDDAHYVLSSSLMKLSCDLSKANPKFLYYFFKSSLGKHELLKNASQVGTPGIGQPLTSLKNIDVLFPPIKKQDKIASILFDFDKKIELNRKINQTLEAMAQALFKSWFVDFEPVKAKMAAKAAGADAEGMTLAAMEALSGQNAEALAKMAQTEPDRYAELKATAELFPDALVDSELGEIPAEWGASTLSNIIEFNPQRTLKKGQIAPYLDMKNVPTSGSSVDEIIDREMQSGTKFINGDTLLARITPCLENGKTAFVDFLEKGQVGWGSTEFIVMRPVEPYPVSLGYFIARLNTFRQAAIQSMTGTSGRQRANAKALADLPWVIYPLDLANKFDTFASKFLLQAKNNHTQNKHLAELRDTLLPKLLSGEVSVADV